MEGAILFGQALREQDILKNKKKKEIVHKDSKYFRPLFVIPLILAHFMRTCARQVTDGAYYCYCAYVLRVSRYSDFLSPMLTNTGIFLHGLKLSGESRS